MAESMEIAPAPALYDGPPVAPEDVVSVYVVLNGALGMSPGKMAAQAFHCGWLTGRGVGEMVYMGLGEWGVRDIDGKVYPADGSHPGPSQLWSAQGRRVVVRVAETQHVFDRVCAECIGTAQHDEGLTEVERGAATAFVTLPYRRADAPKILSHKKVQLA